MQPRGYLTTFLFHDSYIFIVHSKLSLSSFTNFDFKGTQKKRSLQGQNRRERRFCFSRNFFCFRCKSTRLTIRKFTHFKHQFTHFQHPFTHFKHRKPTMKWQKKRRESSFDVSADMIWWGKITLVFRKTPWWQWLWFLAIRGAHVLLKTQNSWPRVTPGTGPFVRD